MNRQRRHLTTLLRFLPEYETKTKLRGFSPRTNYTDRATVPRQRS
jgi:hypothetical protein